MTVPSENLADWSIEDFLQDLHSAAEAGHYYEIPPEYAQRLAELIEELLP